MKLSPWFILIFCLHIPLMHSTPWIEDQCNREAALIAIAAGAAGTLFVDALPNLSDVMYYNDKIKTQGVTGKSIDKKDTACVNATVKLVSAACLCIACGARILYIAAHYSGPSQCTKGSL